MKFKLFAVLMATLLVACGGGNSAGPSFVPSSAPNGTQSVPASSTFCFVDDLAQPLANATVGLASGEVIAVVADGCISLPADKSVAYAEAPGFRRLTDFPLNREDVPLPQGTYALWPISGYLEHLEEVDETNGVANSGFASFSGQRPRSGVYTVGLPSEMGSTTSADVNAYRAAMDTILADASADTSNKILFTVATSGAANIQVVVDPALSPFSGYLTVTAYDSKGFIKSAVLKIRNLGLLIDWPGLIRHELGHFNGINHINDSSQRLMYLSPADFAEATDAEVVHIRMRYLHPIRFDARKG